MKKEKYFMTGAMLAMLSLSVPASVMAQETADTEQAEITLSSETENPEILPIPEGAEETEGDFSAEEQLTLPLFVQISEITDAVVFSYTPETAADAVETLTPVLLVYPDEKYTDKESAWKYLEEKGLISLAEQEKAGVFLINPMEEEYTDADIAVYDQVISVFASTGMSAILNDDGTIDYSRIAMMNEGADEHTNVGYTTYASMNYAVGEGRGATFINSYLTQHCDGLAAALTVGGEISENLENYAALPAYIVSGSEEAIAYYKEAAGTDSEKQITDGTEYYDSEDTVCRVVISNEDSEDLTAEILQNGWNDVLRRSTRCAVYKPVWYYGYEEASEGAQLVLQERPVAEELGLVFNKRVSDEEALPNQSYWDEWVPEEALDEDNTEKYALVIVYHGASDDPQFEAESNGWVTLAGEERFIVVAPEDNYVTGTNMMGAEGETSYNIDLLDYICEKYPVDTSRIYAVGFSMGAVASGAVTEQFMDRFAGAALYAPPTASVSDSLNVLYHYEEYGFSAEEDDLPVFYYSGTNDASVGMPLDGKFVLSPDVSLFLNQLFTLNEIDMSIDTDNLDYEEYPFTGFDITQADEENCFANKHGVELSMYSFEDEEGTEMIRTVFAENAGHCHYIELAGYGWDFLKHFSRDTETGTIIYTE